jgi:flagellar basal body L-ring protein FlgH
VRKLVALTAALAALSSAGCGKFLGNLRQDLDDGDHYAGEPVSGGLYPEHGFLSREYSEGGPYADRYAAVGHSERSPASMGRGGDVDQDSWISRDQASANARDRYRGVEPDEEDDGAHAGYRPVMPPPVKRLYKNGARATRQDFVDESPNEGSLWASDGQTNYYFTKNKIRGVGDIVTVSMEAAMVKDVGLEVRRSLTQREREAELILAQNRLNAKTFGLPDPDAPADPNAPKDTLATSQASARAPAAAKDANGKDIPVEAKEPKEPPQASLADIDTSRSLEVKAGDTLLAEIVDRYPNGNYKIRGVKKVPYKVGQPRLITVVGIARSADIGEDDTIASGKLYEYRLEATR